MTPEDKAELDHVLLQKMKLKEYGAAQKDELRVAMKQTYLELPTILFYISLVIGLVVVYNVLNLTQSYKTLSDWASAADPVLRLHPGAYGPYSAQQIAIAIDYPSLYGVLNMLTLYKDELTPSAALFLVKVVGAYNSKPALAWAWSGTPDSLQYGNLQFFCQSWDNWQSGSDGKGGVDLTSEKINYFSWMYNSTSFTANVTSYDPPPKFLETLFQHGLCGYAYQNNNLSTGDLMNSLWNTTDNPIFKLPAQKSCAAARWNAAVQGAVGGSSFGAAAFMAHTARPGMMARFNSADGKNPMVAGIGAVVSLGGMVGMGYRGYNKGKKEC